MSALKDQWSRAETALPPSVIHQRPSGCWTDQRSLPEHGVERVVQATGFRPGERRGEDLKPITGRRPLANHDLSVSLWHVARADQLFDVQHKYDVVRVSLEPATDHRMWQDGKLMTHGPTRIGSLRTSPPGAGVKTSYASTSGSLTSLLIYVEPLVYRQLGLRCGGLRSPPDSHVDGWMAGVAMQLTPLLKEPEHSSSLEIGYLLLASLVHVSKHYGQGSAPIVKGGLSGWQLKRAIESIESGIAENLTIDQLASQVSLSPYHFIRAFQKSTGSSPHRHLRKLRVERAKKLLTTTRMSLSEIAVACGFREGSSLCRAFKDTVGVTPNGFRRSFA